MGVLDAGKDRGQEKRVTEDETVRWHHQLNGHEFEQTVGDGERQGSLVCCSPWGHKELNTTEQLSNNIIKEEVVRRLVAVRIRRIQPQQWFNISSGDQLLPLKIKTHLPKLKAMASSVKTWTSDCS